jgi:hypothetical protein
MALYFVTMDTEKPADPREPVDRLANILREATLRYAASEVGTSAERHILHTFS